jgi:hypothetical protein
MFICNFRCHLYREMTCVILHDFQARRVQISELIPDSGRDSGKRRLDKNKCGGGGEGGNECSSGIRILNC